MTRTLRFDPGVLSKPMVLERPVEVSDGCGSLLLNWEFVERVWCDLRPLRHTREDIAQQQIEDTWHDITLRHHPGVASGCRLVMDARIFEIQTVRDPDERGAYLVCRTREQGL